MKYTKEETEQLEQQLEDWVAEHEGVKELVLHNDNKTEYNHVILSLIHIMNWDLHQAEQVTMIAHHNGTCGLRIGPKNELLELSKQFAEEGITTTID